jgi:hypothetical protein
MKTTLTQKQLVSISRDMNLHFNPRTPKNQFITLFKQIESDVKGYGNLESTSWKPEIIRFYEYVKTYDLQKSREKKLKVLLP